MVFGVGKSWGVELAIGDGGVLIAESELVAAIKVGSSTCNQSPS